MRRLVYVWFRISPNPWLSREATWNVDMKSATTNKQTNTVFFHYITWTVVRSLRPGTSVWTRFEFHSIQTARVLFVLSPLEDLSSDSGRTPECPFEHRRRYGVTLPVVRSCRNWKAKLNILDDSVEQSWYKDIWDPVFWIIVSLSLHSLLSHSDSYKHITGLIRKWRYPRSYRYRYSEVYLSPLSLNTHSFTKSTR
jgi:hypothetical protein